MAILYFEELFYINLIIFIRLKKKLLIALGNTLQPEEESTGKVPLFHIR